LLQQTNKKTNTLNARKFRAANFASKIRAQKFVRNFAAAAAPPPPRAPPENQNLQGETSHRDDDAARGRRRLYFSVFFLFLSHFFGGSGKEEGRQSTSIRRLSEMGEPGNWRFSKQ